MHIPVLLEETIKNLSLSKGITYVDGTLGSAGHALAVWKTLSGQVTIVGFDQDKEAIKRAMDVLEESGCHPILINKNFRHIKSELSAKKIKADVILFDIGLSSNQLDESGRGFTFRKDEPLLMTMVYDPKGKTLTARDLLANLDEKGLSDIIFAYGEEKFARRIARKIVERRLVHPLLTTFDLVSVVDAAVPSWYKRGKVHFATKTFQALRIAVNDELEALKEGIAGAIEILSPGGRFAVITFHSLEDRIVKNAFRDLGKEGIVKVITKKPIGPSLKEVKENSRARSAKLRVIEKI
jgi:16S rRNA (cytosine1402-N4)-methyltransferase